MAAQAGTQSVADLEGAELTLPPWVTEWLRHSR